MCNTIDFSQFNYIVPYRTVTMEIKKQDKETDKKEAVVDLPIDLIQTLSEEEAAGISGGGGLAFPGLGKQGNLLGFIFG